MPRANCETPGRRAMTGVFSALEAPGSALTGSRHHAVSPELGNNDERRRSFSATIPAGLISVPTHNGEELHYPVVQGRAGGSLSPQLHSVDPSISFATRSKLVSRARRHSSIMSTSTSSHSFRQGVISPGGADEDETRAEISEAYRNSRLTPSRIQQHRRVSGAVTHSPPAALAIRSEPVEEMVQVSLSQVSSPFSSLQSTPRHSMRRTPMLGSRTDYPGAAADVVLGGNPYVNQNQRAMAGVASIRVEEVGVSTPEMAEYFTENAVSMSNTCESARALSRGGSEGVPIYHVQSVCQRSLAENIPQPTACHDTHAVLTRLMHFMEDQSASMHKLQQRMDALESTSNSLLERVQRIESSAPVNLGGITRISAESTSPSVTRQSGSPESLAGPSTRAPSKVVN
ncbi:hypothetical protein JKF63_02091 [Porcisia hertigi]|uniref:Uncharacterized protein n=1 Tax=Porcisia hertigi TaxID=2761500 RepID=A0A836LCC9_9TRYP|nr:hypothetical protein JKF63_02091 [Porcisia hertigi]